MFKYTINYSKNYSINYFMCVKFIKQRSFISILKLNMEEVGGQRSFSVCNFCIFNFCIYSESLRKKKMNETEKEALGTRLAVGKICAKNVMASCL